MIRDLVAIFGVIAGFSYYVLTVRNAQRTRELTLKAQEHATETRETQIFMQLYQNLNNEDIYKKWAELVNQEKIEFNEYVEKYDSSVNPSHFAMRSIIWYSYNTIGELVRQGKIELDLVDRIQVGVMATVMWDKWEHIIKETRIRETAPDLWSGFEYLCDEIKSLRSEKGFPEFTYPK